VRFVAKPREEFAPLGTNDIPLPFATVKFVARPREELSRLGIVDRPLPFAVVKFVARPREELVVLGIFDRPEPFAVVRFAVNEMEVAYCLDELLGSPLLSVVLRVTNTPPPNPVENVGLRGSLSLTKAPPMRLAE
jgi:hypothetical protein